MYKLYRLAHLLGEEEEEESTCCNELESSPITYVMYLTPVNEDSIQ